MTTSHQRSGEHPQWLLDLDAEIAAEDREDEAARGVDSGDGLSNVTFEDFPSTGTRPRAREQK